MNLESDKYTLERTEAFMTVGELLTNYYDRERFVAYCRKCENYGRLWSCPEYGFLPLDYLKEHEGLWLIATRIWLDPQLREEIITREGLDEVSREIVGEVKEAVDRELLAEEKAHKGLRMLSCGGCRLCHRCARLDGMPCRQPGRMRYSLESLGCDVTALARDKLGLEFQWIDGRLPEYLALVNGMLVKEPPEGEMK